MARSEFVAQTSDALDRCAAYIIEHKEELVDEFAGGAGGCTSWSMTFTAGSDGIFPWVEVRTNCERADVIGAYRSADRSDSKRF